MANLIEDNTHTATSLALDNPPLPNSFESCLDELDFLPKSTLEGFQARLTFIDDMRLHVRGTRFEGLLKTSDPKNFDLMINRFLGVYGCKNWGSNRSHLKGKTLRTGFSWADEKARIEDGKPDSRFIAVLKHIFHLKAQKFNRKRQNEAKQPRPWKPDPIDNTRPPFKLVSESTPEIRSRYDDDERKRPAGLAFSPESDHGSKHSKVIVVGEESLSCGQSTLRLWSRPTGSLQNLQDQDNEISADNIESLHNSAEKPADKLATRSIDSSMDKVAKKPVDHAVDKSADKVDKKTADKAIDDPEDKTISKPVYKTVEGSVDKMVNKLTDEPVKTPMATETTNKTFYRRYLRVKKSGESMIDSLPSQGRDFTHSSQSTSQSSTVPSRPNIKGPFLDEEQDEQLFISDFLAQATSISQPPRPESTTAVPIPEPLVKTYLRVTASCRMDLAPVHIPYDVKADTECLFRSLTERCPVPAERAGQVIYISVTFSWNGERLLIQKGYEADLNVFKETIVQAWEEDMTRFRHGCKVEMMLHVDD
ncbi:MAG: hypothetical protein LQ343_006404 [Gyalolechia ehrenbergii]|nr:MAG: hypothetical protein LQ343_006404 [Gyalolechia ehrenbergii]